MPTNRLVHEKSPYLLQHAHNPVDWFPWGEEAFAKARQEDKPIFLSIGYSTCHWCHVMEKESFENAETAQMLNDSFVCIKVDREERPDIDNIYMSTCQLMTGSGGWPLTIIMTPEKKPFFAATYIPKENRFGRVGLTNLIPKIKVLWNSQRNNIIQAAEQVVHALQHLSQEETRNERLDDSILTTTFDLLVRNFDETNGGFGSAPKFPTPHNLFFLQRFWKRSRNSRALTMIEKTLQHMHNGGIFDHLGYGFHRYSTDEKWLLPHFEKMLYDQALLALAYTEAFQVTDKTEYEQVARSILTYVMHDMASPQGGFYSAEDADSEGKEGKFYVWTYEEIVSILRDEAQLFIKVFNIKKEGNFIEESTGSKNGTNILYLNKSFADLAEAMNMTEEELGLLIETARKKLFHVRNKRIRPHKDDKILTNWNGLMIAAFAKAAQVYNNPAYTVTAQKAVDFINTTMSQTDGRLLHRYRDGQAALNANLDDYAYFIWGLIELYEATFDFEYLKTALSLNQQLISYFWDKNIGGFFFTPDDGEKVLIRQKHCWDGALPSGNAVALFNLLRLGKLTQNIELLDMAERCERVFAYKVKQNPVAHTQFMVAIDFMKSSSHQVVIVGDRNKQDTMDMLTALRNNFLPHTTIIIKPLENEAKTIPHLNRYTSIGGKATAYVCVDFQCVPPTTNVNKMLELLNGEGTTIYKITTNR